jgi:putative acetyltransferase
MKEVEIRIAEPEDASEIASVLAESFAEYESLYTADAYAATTPKSDVIRDRFGEGEMWVAVLDGKVVGTVSVVFENESLYIRSMAILPIARGNKIGEQLLTKIENYAANGYRRLFLSTTPFLHRAIRLYENFGFQPNDEPPHELCGTPLLTMVKSLHISISKV